MSKKSNTQDFDVRKMRLSWMDDTALNSQINTHLDAIQELLNAYYTCHTKIEFTVDITFEYPKRENSNGYMKRNNHINKHKNKKNYGKQQSN